MTSLWRVYYARRQSRTGQCRNNTKHNYTTRQSESYSLLTVIIYPTNNVYEHYERNYMRNALYKSTTTTTTNRGRLQGQM